MVQKNIELELQALEVLQRQLGTIPDSMRPMTAAEKTPELEQVQRQNSTIQRSKEEEERGLQETLHRLTSETQTEDKQFEENLAKAIADSQADRDRTLAKEQLEQQQLEKALALSLEEMRQNTTATQPSQPVAEQPILTSMSSTRSHMSQSSRKEASLLSQLEGQRHPVSSSIATSESTSASASESATNSAVSAAMTSTSSCSSVGADQIKLPQVDKRRMLHTLAGLQGIQCIPQGASGNAASEWLKRAQEDIRGGLMTSPEGLVSYSLFANSQLQVSEY